MKKEKEELPEGMEECPTCKGKKEVMISCCTGDVVDDDIAMCPKCHEGLGEEECPDCEGLGYVPETKADFTPVRGGLNTAAEALYDRMKEGDI